MKNFILSITFFTVCFFVIYSAKASEDDNQACPNSSNIEERIKEELNKKS